MTLYSLVVILFNFDLVSCSTSTSECCSLTCIQVSQKSGKVVWYCIYWRIFHSLLWSTTFSSVTQLCPTLCDPMDYIQHARLPCPSPSPGAYSNSCPLSQWCHPTITSSVAPFSSCLQFFPVSESFPVSQSFTSGGQRIGVSTSASVLPMNIQDWFPLGWTALVFL